jgi:hypothetical protein
MSALEKQLEKDNIEYDKFSFEHDEEQEDIDQVLLEEVGVEYASKYRSWTTSLDHGNGCKRTPDGAKTICAI